MNTNGVSTTGYIESISATGAWIATQAEAEAGINDDQLMTPLRTKQAIDAQATASTTDRIVSGTASFVISGSGLLTHTRTGNATFNMSGTGSNAIQLGEARTTDNYAYIDLIGDTTYSDFGLRLIRDNTGANASSWLQHRGTGSLNLQTTDNAPIRFNTTSLERMRVDTNGYVGINTTSPQVMLDVRGSVMTQSPITISNTSWAELDLRTNRATTNEKLWNIANDSGTGNLRVRALTDDRTAETITNPLVITRGGNVGLSMTPSYRLDVNGTVRTAGDFITNSANGLRMVYGNYGAFWRQDGANLYQMITASADQYGSYNSLRPLTINLASGAVTVGTALTNTANQIEIQGTTPRLMFTDTDSASRFWTYVDGTRFYILADRDNSGAWESTHPLELNTAGSGSGALFGQTIWTAGNHGSGSGLNADLLDGLDSTAFLRTTVNQWNTSTDAMERIYFSNGGRTYMKGGGASDYILTLRNNSNADVAHFSSDGNMYSNVLGNWLTAFLNQSVKTDGIPTFNNVYVSSLGNWLTAFLNQSVRSDANPYFGTANTRLAISNDGSIRLVRSASAASPDTNGYIDFTKNDVDYARIFFQDNIKRINIMGSTVAGMALYVQGPVSANGAYTNTSDARLKKDIHDLSYGLADVMKLRPVTFQWKTQAAPWQQGRKVGLIAQEVQKIVPEIVTTEADVSKTLSIAYGDLVPVLIKSVQQLKSENDQLKQNQKTLEQRLEALEKHLSEK